ncbi:ABC-F type ribosomal protection protein [Virgibacillus sp. 179-BFC.A HS]|uniref:ABC-F type ribosomal protection protein n=1 Tax=Tigheibacillus jepli TaxID=3035914 RepID=A0ABU5CF76_9BACI|nr:ABC-F type ribosomal protection protein [Virgibacillus sp. 179-BFC.A HS]MDY0404964.1 ABC-F type ribosomal protection protein [Virgibacillus sp. 179-BFC.A HS]
MLLLEIKHLKQYVQDRLLLDIDHLQIHTNDCIGLIGRNGSGKTTLLQILAKKIVPEQGTVMLHAQCELLPQLKQMNTTKSGGEVTQTYIQEVLIKNPEIFLADEPTTNLDTKHIEGLEKQFGKRQGATVIVSHDRAFLDSLCTTIWELNDAKITEYTGNYSDYVRLKEVEQRQEQLAYEKYVKKKKQLEDALKLKEKKAERATKKPKPVSKSEAKLKGAKPYFAKKQKKLHKTAAAIETRLEKLEKVEKIKELPAVKMDLPDVKTYKHRTILRVENVAGFIGKRKLWDKTSFQIQAGDKVAIIGPNGSGKTTLLRKIIGEENGITLSPSVKVGYFSQSLNILNTNKSIMENVQISSKQNETLIRTVLARMHFFRDDVYKCVGDLSGGERVKVALAKVFLSNINTLILDEPTNFLDILSIEALESLLQEYDGTIMFVSHDRKFIANIATRILTINNQRITLFDGGYREYQQAVSSENGDDKKDRLLLIDTQLTEVLSRLSIEPSAELERQVQQLLQEKRNLTE